MTDNGGARVSSDESQTRQRKKRKWDQPAESFVAAAAAAGLIVPGALPLNNLGSLLASPMVASSSIVSPVIPVASAVQQSSTVNSKLNQVKIQEDLVIAREIVINDVESSLRYRLTKRQTQEEILNRTGAVVITRGKYRPPNTPSDEKPLYLHISAAAHIKETVERIIAVDRAAAMIEDMMKQGPNFQFPLPSVPMTNVVQAGQSQSLSACIYLGFDVDPSCNIAARIRGPNDLYISHIMNETGATVSLKGRGSGALEGPHGEGEQPLHLLLSSNNQKSLDDAKRLAENLLDTISAEYGASRVSSAKVYGAVPPPPQLLPATEVACKPSMSGGASTVSSSSVGPITAPAVSSIGLPNIGNYMQPALTGGTSYRGYEGIYPQATPLQQVALALKQSPSVTSSIVVPTAATASVSLAAKSSTSSVPGKEKKPPQRRKFQELPAGQSFSTRPSQGLESVNPDTAARDLETAPSSSDKISPPPPPPLYKSMPPPPPPPKFTSEKPTAEATTNKIDSLKETRTDPVPDTLLKLVEYDEEDDDPDETVEDSTAFSTRKPFWAV